MKAEVKWINKLRLEGKSEKGQKIVMDSVPAGGMSEGPTPKELVLRALAGCTMMDVITMLQKQKIDMKKFSVEVNGDVANEHPKVFTKINVKYIFVSDDLDDTRARQAIELSREKFCAVSNMLNKSAEITYTLEINKNTI